MVFREMLEKLALLFLLLPAGGLALVLGLRWLLGWMDERGLILYRNDTPVYHSVGHALVNLNSIYEPQKKFTLEAQREEVEQDGESGPDDPRRHLRRPATRKPEGRRTSGRPGRPHSGLRRPDTRAKFRGGQSWRGRR